MIPDIERDQMLIEAVKQHRTYIIDVDGTLANIEHRLHHIKNEHTPTSKNWDAFFYACADDEPIVDVIEVVRALGFWADTMGNIEIVYLTGRPERVRQTTINWLMRYGLPKGQLIMREDEDHRTDEVVKKEMLEKLLRTGTRIAGVFEDRPRVCRMWREAGITTFQLAHEEF